MVVFRNKEYYSRNVNEGPTPTNGSERSGGKDASNPFVGFLKTVVVFCTTNKAFRNMMVVFRNTDNYFRKKKKGFNNMVISFRKRSNYLRTRKEER